MLVMLTKYFPLKKIIAALLPFCFLWLFAACVSTCADEAAEIHQHSFASTETADASEGEACTVINAPAATVSERTVLNFQFPAVAVRCLNFPVKSFSFVNVRVIARENILFADPPLKRLPVLRI